METQSKNQRLSYISTRMKQLNEDIMQYWLGADFGTIAITETVIYGNRSFEPGLYNVIDIKIAEFKALHNELRELVGKEPRIYKEENKIENITEETTES